MRTRAWCRSIGAPPEPFGIARRVRTSCSRVTFGCAMAERRAEREARAGGWRGLRVLTIGHSTRTLDDLVELLRAAGVSVLADVRTVPRSRRSPHFDRAALGPALRARRIRYVHLPELCGLRK